MLLSKYWKYGRWGVVVQKKISVSKFVACGDRKLFSLHYRTYRNWRSSWVQLNGNKFYPGLDYYVETFIERYEKYDIMGLFFRFLMRFKTHYKFRIDAGYFNLYYFSYLSQIV